MTSRKHQQHYMSAPSVDGTAVLNAKRRPSLARVLSLFVIGAAIALLTALGSGVHVWVGNTLTDMQEATIEHQMEHTRQRIENFIDYHTRVLQDKARFPVLIQGVMQPEVMSAQLADFMDGVFVLGNRVQLALLDYKGRLIHASQRSPLMEYQELTWIKDLTDGTTPHHIEIHQTDSGYFWCIAVPVRFHQNVEGILVAELPFLAIGHPDPHYHRLAEVDNRIEFHHKNQLIYAFGNELVGNAQELELPNLGLVLRFFWDRRALVQARADLLLKIFVALALLSVLILALALYLVELHVAKPLKVLRTMTHAIATGNRKEHAPTDFPLKELLLLSTDFNLMADKISAREQTLKNEVRERRETEAALLKSEQRFRTLVEYAPEAIVVLDLEAGRFVDANENAINLFGYPREALLKLGPVDVSPTTQPGGRPSAILAPEILDNVEAGEVPVFEWIHRNASGQDFPCEIRLVRLPTAKRKLVRGSITDITERKQAEELRRVSELVFQAAKERIAVVSIDYRYRRVSKAYYDSFGLSEADIVGRHVSDVLGEEAFNKHVKPNLDRCFAGEEVEFERWFTLGPGKSSSKYMVAKYSPLRNERGTVIGALAIIYDITDRKRAEELLFEEKERAQVTLQSIGDAVISTDADGRIYFLNPIAEALTGWRANEAMGRPLVDVFHIVDEDKREPAPDPVARSLVEGKVVGLTNHTVVINRSGIEYAIEASAAPITSKNGAMLGAVLVFRDVTEARRLSRQVSYQATHDSLTGLINRAEFDRRLRRVLETARADSTENALAYLDLDQFKLVNDTSGHVAGDELLRQISQLLNQHIRKRDTLARLGGDEFGLLMEHCSLKEAKGVAENLIQTVGEFVFPWEEHSFSIGVSIGLVSVDQKSSGVDSILSAADSACYIAKELGRNRVHVHQEDDEELAQRHGEMQWAAHLPRALREDRFLLYFQRIAPIDNLEGNKSSHYELLLRMKDETGKLIIPSAFLRAAERYTLSDKLDRWMIERAFSWLQTHPAHLEQLQLCSINLSGLSLSNEAFLAFVMRELEGSGIPPEKICFEITETVAIANLSSATGFIKALKERGCRLALDHFGSGLSSFAYLKNLPVDFLKIDGLFVKDILDDPMDLAMVKSINDIGHVMGKQTIAEFVENEGILEMLTEIGVDYVQGYGIDRPRPVDDVLSLK